MNETETTFTLDELLAALTASTTAAGEESPAALTTRRMREITGWSQARINNRLRELIDAGQVECVRVPVIRIDGSRTAVPGYRLKATHGT